MSNPRLNDLTETVTLTTLRYRITEDTDLDALYDQINNDLQNTPVADVIAPVYDDDRGAPSLEFSSTSIIVRILDSDGCIMDAGPLPTVLHIPSWNPRNGSYFSN